MKLGDVLKKERENKGVSAREMARQLEIELDEYERIEAGASPLEAHAAMVVNFAKAVGKPVNEIYYPCGIPFQELDDYP